MMFFEKFMMTVIVLCTLTISTVTYLGRVEVGEEVKSAGSFYSNDYAAYTVINPKPVSDDGKTLSSGDICVIMDGQPIKAVAVENGFLFGYFRTGAVLAEYVGEHIDASSKLKNCIPGVVFEMSSRQFKNLRTSFDKKNAKKLRAAAVTKRMLEAYDASSEANP